MILKKIKNSACLLAWFYLKMKISQKTEDAQRINKTRFLALASLKEKKKGWEMEDHQYQYKLSMKSCRWYVYNHHIIITVNILTIWMLKCSGASSCHDIIRFYNSKQRARCDIFLKGRLFRLSVLLGWLNLLFGGLNTKVRSRQRQS